MTTPPDLWPLRLRRLRERNAWSQRDLARALHVCVRSVQHWESAAHVPAKIVQRRLNALILAARRRAEQARADEAHTVTALASVR